MRTTQRRAQAGLIDQVIEQPTRFNFFQAVRLFDVWLRRGNAVHGKTLDGVLRFKNSVSLSFPPSQIEAVAVIPVPIDASVSDGAHAVAPHDPNRLRYVRLTPAFMGYLGVNGVLPYDYTATIAAQIAFEKNEAGRAFFDSFSHRSMLLFYRAWAKCRIECRGEADGRDGFLDVQLALAGRARKPIRLPAATTVGTRTSDKILPDEVIARYAGLIRHRPLQVDMLAGVLSEYFSVPFRCQPFVGEWTSLGATICTELGAQNSVLGRSVMLGERYWRRDGLMRLWIGPLTHPQFDSFLPGGSATKALKALLALFALPAVAFEVRPILKAAEVRPAMLDGCARIGLDAVVLSTPQEADHDSTSYRITYSQE